MSRQLFLFVSVASLAATTWLSGGVRSEKIEQFVHAELRADLISLREDVRIVRQQAGLLQRDLKSLWLDARSDAVMLEADTRFEARRLVKPFLGPNKED